MIRMIAAIDDKRGIATENGIPWNLPSDRKYYRDHIKAGVHLMGAGMYAEMTKPLSDVADVVLTHSTDQPLSGFEFTHNLDDFFNKYRGQDIWVAGGAKVFEQTLEKADELYLTRVAGDFKCTKFFPPFEDRFTLVSQSDPLEENGIKYYYQVWSSKTKKH